MSDRQREEAKRFLIESLEGLDPKDYSHSKRLKEALADWRRRLPGEVESRISDLTTSEQSDVARAVEAAAVRFDKEHVRTQGEGLRGDEVRWAAAQTLRLSKAKVPARDKHAPSEMDVAHARQAGRLEGMEGSIRRWGDSTFSNGHSESHSSKDGPARDAKKPPSLEELKKEERRSKINTLKGPAWGAMSEAAAAKLVDQGFDPRNPPKRIDAGKWGMNWRTINRLVDRGIDVHNTPGSETRQGGFSKNELVRGRLSGSDSPDGQARIERRRGLFFKRTVYAEDSRGNATATTLDPRHGGRGFLAGTKNATFGSLRRAKEARKREREEEKLQDNAYLVKRARKLEERRRIVETSGRLGDATGVRRWWLRQRLAVLDWTLQHKRWVAFLLALAVAFVPFGILPYAGWGIAALAMTAIKYGALVLVNVYNLLASIIVSLLNTVGNTVSGFLEAATRGILQNLGLDPVVCTGTGITRTCADRVFSYTVPKVDVSFPGLTMVPKPPVFDNRTLLELVLGLFGIHFDVFDQILRWIRWRG